MHKLLIEGRALIIVGPQGSGKTTLADRIAKRVSRRMSGRTDGEGVMHCYADALVANLNVILACEHDVVVADGFPTNMDQLELVKSVVTNENVAVNAKGRDPFTVKSPRLIFCCTEMPVLDPAQRRFITITLPG